MIKKTALWLVLLMLTAGQAIACYGNDLWPGLSKSSRSALTAPLSKDVFATGRFFKVTKDGKSSFLFGTMHAPPLGKLRMPETVVSRLRKSKVLFVEVTNPAEKAFFGDIRKYGSEFLAKSPTGFHRQFSAEEWHFVRRVTKTAGLTNDILQLARPWYVYMQMSSLGCGRPNPNKRPIMDAKIEQIARGAGLRVRGLETPLQAIQSMQGFSAGEYAAMIRAELFSFQASDPGDMYLTRLNMYHRGDIQLIWQLQMQQFAGFGDPKAIGLITKLWQDRMLGKRNTAWLPALRKALAKGDAFVAVGALHLGGKHGLMRSLQRDGYKVTRIKFRY